MKTRLDFKTNEEYNEYYRNEIYPKIVKKDFENMIHEKHEKEGD